MQQRTQTNNSNTNDKLMKIIIEEYQHTNNEYPLSFEEFVSDLMAKYNEQNDIYDPSKYFRDSYKHLINLDNPFNDSVSGKLLYSDNQPKEGLHYLSNNSPLRIKAKRVPRPQQPVISFGEQQPELVNLKEEDNQCNPFDDERPIKPLENQEYYPISNQQIERQENRNKSKEYLQKKSVQILPCNLRQIEKRKRHALRELKNREHYLESQAKVIKKYVQSNLYLQKEGIEFDNQDVNEEEKEMAKKYFANQLVTLEEYIRIYKTENQRLRKETLDLKSVMKSFEESKNQFQFQQQIQQEEMKEWIVKEQEKIATQQQLLEMAKKTFKNEPNQKFIEQNEQQAKQIEKLKQEQMINNERLTKKKNKYVKYYQDMNHRVKDLEEEINQQKIKIQSLSENLSSYENNAEVQELLLKQRKDAEEKLKQQEKIAGQIHKPKAELKVEETVKQISLMQYVENQEFTLSIKDINKYVISDEFQYDYNQFYKIYCKQKVKKEKVIEQVQRSDGKTLKTYKQGKKEVIGMKGFIKEIFPNDYVIVHFPNKDIKQELPNGIIIYYFAQSNSTQTTLPKGINVIYFPNKQLEITYVDGTRQILFPDGTEKYLSYLGEEEVFFPDGVKKTVDQNRLQRMEYPDGKVKEKQIS